MISFIVTRLLYAVLFFLLGAWTASVAPDFQTLMRRATQSSVEGFDKMREWTSGTLRTHTQDEQPPASTSAVPETVASKAPASGAEASRSAMSQPAAPSPAVPKPVTPKPATSSSVDPKAGAPSAAAAKADALKTPAAAAPANAGELLIRAREAYARRDVIGAINAYRAYIDRNPDAIDARGELGNVYFAIGRRHDAAELYFEAARKRLDAGDIAGAKELLAAVRLGDPALGQDLDRRIAKAEGQKK